MREKRRVRRKRENIDGYGAFVRRNVCPEHMLLQTDDVDVNRLYVSIIMQILLYLFRMRHTCWLSIQLSLANVAFSKCLISFFNYPARRSLRRAVT